MTQKSKRRREKAARHQPKPRRYTLDLEVKSSQVRATDAADALVYMTTPMRGKSMFNDIFMQQIPKLDTYISDILMAKRCVHGSIIWHDILQGSDGIIWHNITEKHFVEPPLIPIGARVLLKHGKIKEYGRVTATSPSECWVEVCRNGAVVREPHPYHRVTVIRRHY